MTHSRRSRHEWDEFARRPASRRRRATGRLLLAVVTAGLIAFAFATVVLPSSGTGWAAAVGVAAAVATAVVLLRQAARAAMGWGAKPTEARWVNPPRRGGRRR